MYLPGDLSLNQEPDQALSWLSIGSEGLLPITGTRCAGSKILLALFQLEVVTLTIPTGLCDNNPQTSIIYILVRWGLYTLLVFNG